MPSMSGWTLSACSTCGSRAMALVRGAENEIRDALTNLIFNAVDALPQGGRIVIRTRADSVAVPHGGSELCALLEVVDRHVWWKFAVADDARQSDLEAV